MSDIWSLRPESIPSRPREPTPRRSWAALVALAEWKRRRRSPPPVPIVTAAGPNLLRSVNFLAVAVDPNVVFEEHLGFVGCRQTPKVVPRRTERLRSPALLSEPQDPGANAA